MQGPWGRAGSQRIDQTVHFQPVAAPVPAASTHTLKGPEMRFKINAETFSHGWELPALRTNGYNKGIPNDAHYKPGSGGQLIAFVPSLNFVITRQTGSSGSWEYEGYLRRACAAVLQNSN